LTRNTMIMMMWCVLLFATAMSFGQVQPRGTEGTFDLVAWNIENFPQHGQTTVDTVRMIILGLQVDLITVEEIADTVAFRDLINSLDDWQGVYSADEYGPGDYQKTGILYRSDQVTLSNVGQIFTNEWYPFPRPPLMAQVTWQHGSRMFDFYLIVVHLKAGGGSENMDRRRQACQRLKSFIDQSVGEGDEPDFIVAGDFNDDLDDPPEDNSFTVFLNDSMHYRFLTLPLAGDPFWASYPSTGSLIDHVLVTSSVLDEYADGETFTLRLDYEVSNYSYWVSDHRPMFSKFLVPANAVTPAVEHPIPTDARIVAAYPNPFNPSISVEYELAAPSVVTVAVYNILGQEVRVLTTGSQSAGIHRIRWDGEDRAGLAPPSGVYFVRLTTDQTQSFRKILLIR
jgi:endonuclease/exonuclease/phosphatase family metal-dependent hydrolase